MSAVQTPSDSHDPFFMMTPTYRENTKKSWEKDGSSDSRPTVLQFRPDFFLLHCNDET
jgi:hypothetical protein